MALLEVRGISKSFRGLKAVSNASFELPEGSINALIGPNGAGKTTIFNMIAGVYKPDVGKIVFRGKEIQGLRPDQVCAAGIGRTFQIVKPFAGLTVLQNVMVGAFLRERSADSARKSSRSSTSTRRRASRPPRSPCPTASASRSRAPSPPGPSSCSSTK
jgi:branched-chain amino acid transport system ATP-binding protein